MSNQEDWLWRPVRAGLCKAESVLDGTLSINDIATLNEVLDVEQENKLRILDAQEKG